MISDEEKPPGFWISFARWFCPPALFESIEIQWRVFVFAGLVSLALALSTVVFRIFRTANENPVDRLKCE